MKNSLISNPPFLIFYRGDREVEEEVNPQNFSDALRIPHSSDLMSFYENFYMGQYPKKEISMLGRMFFIVNYDGEEIHAIDGLGNGLIALPVQSHFIVKVYFSSDGEKYPDMIKYMMEVAA